MPEHVRGAAGPGGVPVFNITEWAAWITLLVWAFASGGVVAASVIALIHLVPASLLAAPATGS